MKTGCFLTRIGRPGPYSYLPKALRCKR